MTSWEVDQRLRFLDELYERLAEVEQRAGRHRLADASGRHPWPDAGVYFFYEPGERREDGVTARVVRVGTHATTGRSETTLWSRLRQHRGTVGGSNPGGGNHRGSIFRLHVGTALINRCGWDGAARTWGQGSSASAEIRVDEAALERAVSEHIGRMEFVAVGVSDREARARLEREAIALLSNWGRPSIDPPSETWLGRSASREEVRASGLWNVNHVADTTPTAPTLELIR